ncbi:glycosyltransferase family 2 protein [Stenotrophomonas maltophilia]|uniref:glycosyltransferase family A protein n=1 Tax=Stenotrophomonas maltophilia TaxID=40324 RepID=UPI0013D90E68|nr:glycosyltransferase family A protein [Stenotrophomonas maltophilia]MBH1591394.1 glycosyltransferase family 2 protein [Stenotrophomonas maltophilia]
MLTLLTATGARPAAWALCERWMARQDYAGPVRWIIVDDGPMPQPVTFRREGWQLVLVRPSPHWAPGQNTQARNLLKGLAAVGPDDRLVIIEDDDWYAPDWLTTVAAELEHAELVGEHRARYYNVEQRRGRQLANTGHASLCSTAMRGSALQDFADACRSRPKFIDLELWRRARGRRLFGGHRVVGIKGLPGRGGIGMGHDPDFKGEADASGALLRRWVGEDAEVYL